MKKLISACLIALSLTATMAFPVAAGAPTNEESVQISAESEQTSLLRMSCVVVQRVFSDISPCIGGSKYGTLTTTYVCEDGSSYSEVQYNRYYEDC